MSGVFDNFGLVEAADADRIVRVCAANGLTVTAPEARAAWERYSESMFAGWLYLPDGDATLWGIIRPWLTAGHTPEEQARRDRVTAAITKFQSKPAKPPRRWRR